MNMNTIKKIPCIAPAHAGALWLGWPAVVGCAGNPPSCPVRADDQPLTRQSGRVLPIFSGGDAFRTVKMEQPKWQQEKTIPRRAYSLRQAEWMHV